MASKVTFALLYRTPREWRISVRTPEELACGALSETPPTAPFDSAAREFEQLLRTEWQVGGPLIWEELKRDWWGVDLVPGALRAAGERAD